MKKERRACLFNHECSGRREERIVVKRGLTCPSPIHPRWQIIASAVPRCQRDSGGDCGRGLQTRPTHPNTPGIGTVPFAWRFGLAHPLCMASQATRRTHRPADLAVKYFMAILRSKSGRRQTHGLPDPPRNQVTLHTGEDPDRIPPTPCPWSRKSASSPPKVGVPQVRAARDDTAAPSSTPRILRPYRSRSSAARLPRVPSYQ